MARMRRDTSSAHSGSRDAAGRAVVKPRVFTGAGTRKLAPFRLARAGTLRWQTTGGLFGGVFAVKLLNRRADYANPQLVFTRARTGSVHLRPGRYVLEVDSSVRWTITVS
jgi:hypothetical protein